MPGRPQAIPASIPGGFHHIFLGLREGMAQPALRLDSNVPGDFFVDSTCIDCATCRWVAPASFDADGGMSRIFKQPETSEEKQRALMALVA